MKYFRSKEYGVEASPQLVKTWDYPYPQMQVGDLWRQISDGCINVGGVWRQASEIQINISGAWKSLGS
jgi:hypothetical protein